MDVSLEERSAIWSSTTAAYDRAQGGGSASMTDTAGELLKDPATGIEFVLRVATIIRQKPIAERPTGPKPPKGNPFLPYDPALWVCHLSPTHTLLLNKFNVVAHHLLVVTRDYVMQDDGLDAGDLEATWKVLLSMQPGAIAFFNCGPDSGASQPHKHVQVVPLPFHPTQPLAPPVQPAVEAARGSHSPLEAFPVKTLPCQAYACALPSNPTLAQLQEASQQLHGKTQEALRAAGGQSYNVLLTTSFMMYIPRRPGQTLAPNALTFAGTMLVRFEEDLQDIRKRGPGAILAETGLPWSP